ncbi:MAG: PAS-domain containing protein, partial [Beijerinckiaceae bacterium]|nr:PAS-domain containing protein [Beijerinckiaceae bacterium]
MGGCLRQHDGIIVWRAVGFAMFCNLVLAAAPVFAGESGQFGLAAGAHSLVSMVELTLIAGLATFSGLVALLHISQRRHSIESEARLYTELSTLRAKLDRAEIFLGAESQIIISWNAASEHPDIEGDPGLIPDRTNPRSVLAFESWLPPALALTLDNFVGTLRARGESFRVTATSLDGKYLEIAGRPVGGYAVLRIRAVSGDRLEAARLQALQAATVEQLHALRALLDAAPFPAWTRGRAGKLSWVNAAYARAVEAKTQEAAASHGIELIESQTREAAAASRGAGAVWHGRAPAVVAGQRHMLEIFDAPTGSGSAGIAADVSEIESLRATLEQQTQAHARTLDQLSTAVAIFDGAKQLVFHNVAYRQLWALDQAWLDEKPTDSEVLDRLRAARLLPEQADFRAWKAELLTAYQSLDTDEQVWFLPDGRTLRAVIGPNAQGGVTYLFDDVSERYSLVSQFNASIRVQSETLDTLKEGVAVFGSDGRLKLFNPAFAAIWKLGLAGLDGQPHIDHVAQICAPLFADEESWAALRAAVAGLPDQRVGLERRLARRDGSVLDCAAAPLPDGATLLTFIDITASVDIERALTERNQALSERNQALTDAEKLRNDFVHHVSYELRSPLTNIIGFVQLLDDPAIGPLNSRQREYAGYVMKSSSALLSLINDILDLASIDADAMELALENVDIGQTIRAAGEDIGDRLGEASLTLRVAMAEDIGSFIADGKRIRQILFNLLTNAIGFSSPGQTIELAAARRGNDIHFSVTDEGSGISPEVLEHVFDRFKTYT